jgi:hypothetical protein
MPCLKSPTNANYVRNECNSRTIGYLGCDLRQVKMNRRSLVRGASEDQDSPETVNSIDILEDQYSENTVNNINILEDQNLGDTVNDYPCAAKNISGDAGVANPDRNKRARNISGDAGVANLDKKKISMLKLSLVMLG